jgi:hypothetical protein
MEMCVVVCAVWAICVCMCVCECMCVLCVNFACLVYA